VYGRAGERVAGTHERLTAPPFVASVWFREACSGGKPPLAVEQGHAMSTAQSTSSPAPEDAAAGVMAALPAEPIVRIRPSRSWVALHIRELWAYRELLYFLTWRDVKVRYKQAVLGAAWAIIQPVATMLIFTLFFGKLAKVPSEGVPYPIFAYAALLPWTFFANAISNSGNSLVGNANLITKVYFPRLVVPAAAVGAGLVDFALAFLVFVGLFFYYHFAVTWQVLLFPALLVLTTLLALAVGLWMSALNVKYRDVRYALPFLVQLWMFASPVIYPSSLMPAKWRWVLVINPMTGIIEGFRSSLLGKPILWDALGYSVVASIGALVYAAYFFRHMEREFADVV
jgi:homopolymeric O-antigen transport system permease protein